MLFWGKNPVIHIYQLFPTHFDICLPRITICVYVVHTYMLTRRSCTLLPFALPIYRH